MIKHPLSSCRYRLAAIWFSGAGLIGFLLFVQQIRGFYGPDAELAWTWFSHYIVPTLSLMVAVLVATHHEPSQPETVDRGLFRLTVAVSVVFLVLALATILAQPLSTRTPLELMQDSTLYLTPFQGLATGLLGAFFIKKAKAGGHPVHPDGNATAPHAHLGA